MLINFLINSQFYFILLNLPDDFHFRFQIPLQIILHFQNQNLYKLEICFVQIIHNLFHLNIPHLIIHLN